VVNSLKFFSLVFNVEEVRPLEIAITKSNVHTGGFMTLAIIKFEENELYELICFNVRFHLLKGVYTQIIKLRNPYWNEDRVSGSWDSATKILPNKMNFTYQDIGLVYLKRPVEKESDINWFSIDTW
jgi:hypothetical protein